MTKRGVCFFSSLGSDACSAPGSVSSFSAIRPLYDKSPLPEQNWTGATCDSLRGVFELVDNLHESLGHGKHGYTKPPVGKERNRRRVVGYKNVCVGAQPLSPSLSCPRALGGVVGY